MVREAAAPEPAGKPRVSGAGADASEWPGAAATASGSLAEIPNAA